MRRDSSRRLLLTTVPGEHKDARLVRGKTQCEIAGGYGRGGASIGVPLLAIAMRCVEGGRCVNGVIRGIGDEVDVCGGESATNEADRLPGCLVCIRQLQIRVSLATESFFERVGIRN